MTGRLDRRAVAGLALAVAVSACGRKPPPPPASPRASLKVRMGETGSAKLDPKSPLRCFVQGRFVGETSLAECARRNGLDTGRMDVGVDTSGQVAAAGQGEAELAPLPETVTPAAPAPTPQAALAQPPPPPLGARCLRYAGGGWREAGVGLSLKACVRGLYQGRCVRPGEALYGRYGAQTLRLVPGRVEVSGNNRDFETLVGQDAESCALDG